MNTLGSKVIKIKVRYIGHRNVFGQQIYTDQVRIKTKTVESPDKGKYLITINVDKIW